MKKAPISRGFFNMLLCLYFNATFPFPHVFSLSPFPLCAMLEGTHGDRVAGDNTRHAHRKVSFTRYATRSPTKRTTLVGSLVLIVKLGARCARRLATRSSVSEVRSLIIYRNRFYHRRDGRGSRNGKSRNRIRPSCESVSIDFYRPKRRAWRA